MKNIFPAHMPRITLPHRFFYKYCLSTKTKVIFKLLACYFISLQINHNVYMNAPKWLFPLVACFLFSTYNYIGMEFSFSLKDRNKVFFSLVKLFLANYLIGVLMILPFSTYYSGLSINKAYLIEFMKNILFMAILYHTVFGIASLFVHIGKKLFSKEEYTYGKGMSFLVNGSKKKKVRIQYRNIIFIKAEGSFSRVHYLDTKEKKLKSKIVKKTLKNMESTMGSIGKLMRVHKSFIVNPKRISDIQGDSHGGQIFLKAMKEKICVPYSRSAYILLINSLSATNIPQNEISSKEKSPLQ